MSFFSKKNKNSPKHGTKIPPVAAWGHYNKKQGKKPAVKAENEHREVQISVENVTLSYEGRAVINGLDLEVCAGDYISVIGENGSGKSTLMNSVLGLIKPTSGKIKYHTVSRNQIGVLPQQMPVQNDFPATVKEVIMAGCLARSNKGPFLAKGSKDIAFSSMEKLGITALENRPFRELSGGQRQRVLIARALCAADKMLVLDEPVNGLDPVATADIYALLNDLNARGITIMMVTHDIRSAIKYSSKILRLNKDSAFFGTAEEYCALPEAALYLEDENDPENRDMPYGEGGFRYRGDEK